MRFRPSVTRTRFLLTILVLVNFAVALPAQSPAGRLRGQITDPSGAVIPGAAISLKNSSGLTIPAKSDGVGNYDVRNLTPGKYTVTVTGKTQTGAQHSVTTTVTVQ